MTSQANNAQTNSVGASAPPVGASGPSASALAAGFDAYTTALESGDTPLLGHLVLYSVFDGKVKREDLERWFLDLSLNSAFLPPPIRPVDAFEQVTGPRGVRRVYPLEGTRPLTADGKLGRRPTDGTAKEATLMIRHVRRDAKQIVRHLVREVRDETKTSLAYDTHLAATTFVRDSGGQAGPGAGSLRVDPDHAAINALPADEQVTVNKVLNELRTTYAERCVWYTTDRLRTLIRTYVEHLGAIKVKPTGGVYFVHRTHTDTLAQLRDLVDKMGEGSQLSRVPIPDQAEMRAMIEAAFVAQAKDELDRLARDIATARHAGASPDTLEALTKRFAKLKSATAQHAELLSTTLEDTENALKLVNLQLATLLSVGGSEDEDDE